MFGLNYFFSQFKNRSVSKHFFTFINEETLERKIDELKKEQHPESITSSDSYKLFPNPATDKFYILGSTEREELSVELRDLADKLVLKTVVQINEHKAELKLNLINGIYFVTLVRSNNERIIKKLVISK